MGVNKDIQNQMKGLCSVSAIGDEEYWRGLRILDLPLVAAPTVHVVLRGHLPLRPLSHDDL